MQKSIRINEDHLITYLAKHAKEDCSIAGTLQKRSSRTRGSKNYWFALFQNLLFYFENITSGKPTGLIFLEGCYCNIINDPKLRESDFPV